MAFPPSETEVHSHHAGALASAAGCKPPAAAQQCVDRRWNPAMPSSISPGGRQSEEDEEPDPWMAEEARARCNRLVGALGPPSPRGGGAPCRGSPSPGPGLSPSPNSSLGSACGPGGLGGPADDGSRRSLLALTSPLHGAAAWGAAPQSPRPDRAGLSLATPIELPPPGSRGAVAFDGLFATKRERLDCYDRTPSPVGSALKARAKEICSRGASPASGGCAAAGVCCSSYGDGGGGGGRGGGAASVAAARAWPSGSRTVAVGGVRGASPLSAAGGGERHAPWAGWPQDRRLAEAALLPRPATAAPGSSGSRSPGSGSESSDPQPAHHGHHPCRGPSRAASCPDLAAAGSDAAMAGVTPATSGSVDRHCEGSAAARTGGCEGSPGSSGGDEDGAQAVEDLATLVALPRAVLQRLSSMQLTGAGPAYH
jgi:hypothetical protein